jgi:hypothetical protein
LVDGLSSSPTRSFLPPRLFAYLSRPTAGRRLTTYSSCHTPYWSKNSLSLPTRSFFHSWQSPSFLYFLSRLSVSTHRVFPSHVVSRRRASYWSTNSRPLLTRFSLIYYRQSPSLSLSCRISGEYHHVSPPHVAPRRRAYDWLTDSRRLRPAPSSPLVYSLIYFVLRQDIGLPCNCTLRRDATLLIGRRILVRLRSALLSPLGNLPPIHPLIASHDRTSPYHVIPRGFQLPHSLLVDELSLILDPHFSPFLAVPLLLFLIVLTGEHSPRFSVSRDL